MNILIMITSQLLLAGVSFAGGFLIGRSNAYNEMLNHLSNLMKEENKLKK